MKAVITVIGKDRVGIISAVSAALCEANINILDISQTIMQSIFTMIMIVDIKDSSVPFAEMSEKLSSIGEELGVQIRIQHDEIFNSMHNI